MTRRLALLPALLLLSACAVAPGMTAQEASIQSEGEINNFMPAARELRDNIETQPLFSQAAFWGHEYNLNPSDLEASIKLAAAVRKLGNPSRAVEITQTTRAIHPRDPYLLAEHAAALIADERAVDSIPVLDKGLSLAPQYARLWSLKGAALDQMEDYRTARQHYSRALSITPNDPNILANLGLSHALSGDPATAETWLRRAAAAPGASAGVRQNLALVLQLQGKTDEAEQQARIAGLSRGDQMMPPEPVPALRPRSAAAPTASREPATLSPQATRPQAPAFAGGAPASRLVTQGDGGRPFASASDAARAAARRRQSQSQSQSQSATRSAPLTPEQQQAHLARINRSVQPRAATPPSQRGQGPQQPHIVGPALRPQAPQGYSPQGQYPAQGPAQGRAPQAGYPQAAPTDRRGAARRRR